MAEAHRMRAADREAESALPVIENVKTVTVKTVVGENPDIFMKPAKDIKALDGSDAVFKRKVNYQIKKVQRGEDGAQSKRIEREAEFLNGYNLLDVVVPPVNIDYLVKLYELSAVHHAAVEAKVSNIVGLGYRFEETPKSKRLFETIEGDEAKTKKARRNLDIHRDELIDKFEKFNEEDGFTEILSKVWRDYEITGNGYLEISRKKNGQIGFMGHIPAQTVRIRKRRDGFVQISGAKMVFFANYGAGQPDENGEIPNVPNPLGGGRPNEIIHIKKSTPRSTFYGVPDIIAATDAVAGNKFAADYNLDYFENKAVPRHIITLKGARLGSQAEQSLLSFFETSLKGQNHRSLFIPLPGDNDQTGKVEFNITPVEANIQDASFEKYIKMNTAQILMVHRVPITKIGVAENVSLALAKDADKTFKEQVCAPEQSMLEKKLNRMVDELTDTLELRLNEMTLTDEDTQSKIDERDIKAGIKVPNEVRARRNLPGIKGGNERVDLNAKDKIAQAQAELTTQRERDSQRSAGATDSSGNARNPKGEGRSTA